MNRGCLKLFLKYRGSLAGTIQSLKPACFAGLGLGLGLSETWQIKINAWKFQFGGYRYRHGKNRGPDNEPHFQEEPFIFTVRHTKLPKKAEKIFIVQPHFRHGKERFIPVNHRLSEAKALIESVGDWSLEGTTIQSIRDTRHLLGSGKITDVGKIISEVKKVSDISAIFFNMGKLDNRQTHALEDAWQCKVFDRYRVVLEIFKRRATSQGATLQVQQAELQYLKSHLAKDDLHYDRQGGAGHTRGSGETPHDKDRRIMADKEIKVKKALKHLKDRKERVRIKRKIDNVPQVALIGYTNAGKTTLVKALTGKRKLVPDDKFFATLDTTAHRGRLPSGLAAVFIDTIGFISDLPHELFESFEANLEDIKNADLLLHVRDMSNPERVLQKSTVMEVLERMDLPGSLFDDMIEVQNKIDLSMGDSDEEEKTHPIHLVSATQGTGMNELRQAIESRCRVATGRQVRRFLIPMDGEHLQWLYHYGTVVNTEASEDGTQLYVDAVLDETTFRKWTYKFEEKEIDQA